MAKRRQKYKIFCAELVKNNFKIATPMKAVIYGLKNKIISMLHRNSGIRDIEKVLGVSRYLVLKTLLRTSESSTLSPPQNIL